MHLAGICPGQLVLFKDSRVFRAWCSKPGTPDEEITLFCEEVHDDPVIIRSLDSHRIGAVSELYLDGQVCEKLDGEDLAFVVLAKFENSVIAKGEHLHVNYLGLSLSLKVQEMVWAGDDGQDDAAVLDLTERLEKTSVSNVRLHGPHKFGLVTYATQVKFNESLSQKYEKRVKLSAAELKIGGLDREIDIIKKHFESVMHLSARSADANNGILLWGPPGTGKTMLGRKIGDLLGVKVIRVLACDIYSKFFGEAEANLRNVFKQAEASQPCVVFMDEIDCLCSVKGGGKSASDQDSRATSCLVNLMEDFKRRRLRVVVIGSTNRVNLIDSRLRRAGRLDLEVEISVPTREKRKDILTKLLASLEKCQLDEEALDAIAESTHGFVGADLESLIDEATIEALHQQTPLTRQHFTDAIKRVKPSAMREVLVEVPSVTWDDIGGLEELKLALRQAVEWPLKRPDSFARLGITPPRGLLMYGPPGCSKTMVAKALAHESGLNFLSVRGPELFSKWVGESEQAVRELFRKARQVAPAIVFFDEIDAMCAERGGGSGVSDRVLAQMLTEMDGVEQLRADIMVVAATNKPNLIDRALMRPGRLDRQFYVPLPDKSTREKILCVHTRKRPLEPQVDLTDLAARTEGYSGAELAAVCNEAAYKTLEKAMDGDNGDDEITESLKITKEDFDEALTIVRPRLNAASLQAYEQFSNRKS